MEATAQILGYIITVLCICVSQMKKRWQMLTLSFLANFLNIPMFLLLNGLNSAVMVSIVGSTQCAINGILAYKDKQASLRQKIIFTVLYLIAGALQYHTPLDLLPIIGSLLFMCSGFLRKEQRMRQVGVLNSLVWIVYDCIVGSTAVFAQLFSLGSTLIALYRYRNPKIQQKN